MMIRVGRNIMIDDREVELKFIRASGPGGQNVNKVSTAVQLRFDVGRSPFLPPDVRDRLLRLAGRRVTGDGVLVIAARRFRTQWQNRADAIRRLAELVRRAAAVPPRRRPTRPGAACRERRLRSKRLRSEIKRRRVAVRDLGD